MTWYVTHVSTVSRLEPALHEMEAAGATVFLIVSALDGFVVISRVPWWRRLWRWLRG